ncbi:MAG: hypothetical protein Q4D52_05565 [Eubacteriales bacterium]|nr:hypothetical protein [Eubacteriales bacterium]
MNRRQMEKQKHKGRQKRRSGISLRLTTACVLFVALVLFTGISMHQKAFATSERQTYKTVRVEAGMTVWEIAEQAVREQKVNLSPEDMCRDLIELNGLEGRADQIRSGDVIFLPVYR